MSRALEIMGEACAGLLMVTKRMFGGHGFFAPNGTRFAGIVTDDEIVATTNTSPRKTKARATTANRKKPVPPSQRGNSTKRRAQ